MAWGRSASWFTDDLIITLTRWMKVGRREREKGEKIQVL
jgi:hypothetical protein